MHSPQQLGGVRVSLDRLERDGPRPRNSIVALSITSLVAEALVHDLYDILLRASDLIHIIRGRDVIDVDVRRRLRNRQRKVVQLDEELRRSPLVS